MGGTIYLIHTSSGPVMYGAVYAEPGELLSALQTVGLNVQGVAYLEVNTDPTNSYTVNVTLPNGTTIILPLAPSSATIWVSGNAGFTLGGTTWFSIDGNLYLNFSEGDSGLQFDAYINGDLVIGSAGGGDDVCGASGTSID